MTLDDLQQLLDYHYWARDRLLDADSLLSHDDLTKDLGSSFKSVRETLVHLYAAEWIWCSRWQGTSPAAMPDGGAFADVPTLRRAWGDLEVSMRGVIDGSGRDGVDRAVEYRDLKGTTWHNTSSEMLQHVVNHASYHRGQVTTMLRQLQASPPGSMDLIAFLRSRRPG
jgi:uncharacterized damage-inducible protein DinB